MDPGTAKNLSFCRIQTASGPHGGGEAYVTPGKEPVTDLPPRHLATYIIGRHAPNIRHTAESLAVNQPPPILRQQQSFR